MNEIPTKADILVEFSGDGNAREDKSENMYYIERFKIIGSEK